MLRVFSFTFLLSIGQIASAQDEEIVLPVPDALGTISASYFDDIYLKEEGVQHLGVDIPAPDGSLVVSPVAGTVIMNRTDVSDPFNAYLIIRSSATGFEHVLAHLRSDIEAPLTVEAGDPIGAIVKAGSGPHLHYGINQLSVIGAIDVASGWGFGRGPANASPFDAGSRGWLPPNEVMLGRLLSAASTSSNTRHWWSPGLILSGQANQNNGSTWSIKIEVQSDDNASISYDSIPCAGNLILLSKNSTEVVTQERITENKSNCIDGGTVKIAPAGSDGFSYSWQEGGNIANGFLTVESEGILSASDEQSMPSKIDGFDRPSGFQRIDVASGQGLTGYADLDFYVDQAGEVLVHVAAMKLQYSPNAGFNNIDGKYKGLEVVGFLPVLRASGRDEPVYNELAPIVGALDQNGMYQCTDCTSFVFPAEKMRQADVFLSAFVVGNIIFFGNFEIPTRLIVP